LGFFAFKAMKTFINKHEAAEMLGVSWFALRSWRTQGDLIEGVHYTRFGRNSIRYIKESLEDWAMSGSKPLAQRDRATKSEPNNLGGDAA
jgi:hypothetical protein